MNALDAMNECGDHLAKQGALAALDVSNTSVILPVYTHLTDNDGLFAFIVNCKFEDPGKKLTNYAFLTTELLNPSFVFKNPQDPANLSFINKLLLNNNMKCYIQPHKAGFDQLVFNNKTIVAQKKLGTQTLTAASGLVVVVRRAILRASWKEQFHSLITSHYVDVHDRDSFAKFGEDYPSTINQAPELLFERGE